MRPLVNMLYDGGLSSSWGTRVAYRNKVSDNLEFAAIYDWAGALSPSGDFNTVPANVVDNLATRKHHSVAGRVSGKIPRAGTQFFGELQMDLGRGTLSLGSIRGSPPINLIPACMFRFDSRFRAPAGGGWHWPTSRISWRRDMWTSMAKTREYYLRQF